MTLTKESEALAGEMFEHGYGIEWRHGLEYADRGTFRRRLAAIEAAARAPQNHPDDGHEHRYGCRMCGTDSPMEAERDRLRAALVDVERESHAPDEFYPWARSSLVQALRNINHAACAALAPAAAPVAPGERCAYMYGGTYPCRWSRRQHVPRLINSHQMQAIARYRAALAPGDEPDPTTLLEPAP